MGRVSPGHQATASARGSGRGPSPVYLSSLTRSRPYPRTPLPPLITDPNPLISLSSLQKAYDSLSAKTSALEDADIDPEDLAGFQEGDQPIDVEEMTVDAHFRVINAFEMPGWRFDNVKGTFGL